MKSDGEKEGGGGGAWGGMEGRAGGGGEQKRQQPMIERMGRQPERKTRFRTIHFHTQQDENKLQKKLKNKQN